MVELLGEDGDPLFERPRYHRMLRQAHDANVIELAKTEGDGYDLRLTPEAVAGAEAQDGSSADVSPEDAPDDQPAEKAARSRRASTRKSTRGRGRRAKGDATPTSQSDKAAVEPKAAAPEKDTAASAPAPRKRNPRFRRGSRGGGSGPQRAAPAGDTERARPTNRTSAPLPEARRATPGAPSIGPRVGSQRGMPGSQPASSGSSPDSGAAKGDDAGSRSSAAEQPETSAPAPQPEPTPAPAPKGGVADEDSLLRRMSAALQRVMKGPDAE